MRLIAILITLAGVAVSTATIFHEGAQQVLRILALAGWPILLLAPLHLAAVALDAKGWQQLLSGHEKRPGLAFLTWAAVIRDSIDALLPVVRVGGDLAGIDLLCARGVALPVSAASVVAELVITLIAQALFTLIGAALLFASETPVTWLAWVVAGAMALSIPFAIAVIAAQRRARVFRWLGRSVRYLFRLRLAAVENVARIDDELSIIHRRYKVLAVSCLWELAGLIVTAAEVWLALALMGHPVTPGDAVVIEGFWQALRSIAFVVPAALGVQEVGLIAFGSLAGVPPDVSLALSLAKRLRDATVGIPSLASWLWFQAWHLRHG
ncbi:MAG TPA: lysylphosphatidylglycerol synthase domain-containing protein [Gammaproteobacteria bacterium]|nr:lysylphosphatidylglycerol synthase domain-containing protein [Gammaproteobacteria bacterium]